MKKFKYLGFKEEKIEVREISLGTLVQVITHALISQNKKNMEIRIVDCYVGEIDSYKDLEELLMADFNMDWIVSVYKIECMHDNKTESDFLKVILSDNVEGEGVERK